ncbi:MAG: hypothetical protein V1821_01595, partial [bacterium]
VTEMLLANDPNFTRLITCTTRAPRADENDGVDYHFLSREDFEAGVQRGDYFEWAMVHNEYYGSRMSDFQKLQKAGKDVLVNIDPKGAETIRVKIPEAIIIFLIAPQNILKMRMLRRGGLNSKEMETRLKTAEEVTPKTSFADLVVENKEGLLPETIIAINSFVHQQGHLTHKH